MSSQNTRDDSVLNTGMSSVADRRRYAKQEELHNKRVAQREAMSTLTTQGDTIMQWIDQEIKDAADLTKMILNVGSEEDVRSQLLARQLHLAFLEKAKTRVKKYLKEPKPVVQGESFDDK